VVYVTLVLWMRKCRRKVGASFSCDA
jgi:hypothetical protein